MKSISVQYQELKEGRITQHQFLRNARMLFPNHVTQHNSFEDSVKILKNRGLLNEGDAVKGVPDKAPSYDYPTQPAKYKKVVQEPEVDEQDGIYPATSVTDIPKEEVSKPIKSKNRPDGLEPIKDVDKKNEMKKIRIVKESKKNLTENQVTPKQIQDKYNEMFGKNPQTTFADVAKALGVSEQEIAIALFAPDLAKGMGRINEDEDLSPDAKAFMDMIEKNPTLKSRLSKISNPEEIEDIATKLFAKIDPAALKNLSGVRSAVLRGMHKIAGTTAAAKKEFRPGVDLGKSSEKFFNQFRSPGASGPGQSLNKLKEVIKNLVHEVLDEIGPGGIQAAGNPEEESSMKGSLIKKEAKDSFRFEQELKEVELNIDGNYYMFDALMGFDAFYEPSEYEDGYMSYAGGWVMDADKVLEVSNLVVYKNNGEEYVEIEDKEQLNAFKDKLNSDKELSLKMYEELESRIDWSSLGSDKY